MLWHHWAAHSQSKNLPNIVAGYHSPCGLTAVIFLIFFELHIVGQTKPCTTLVALLPPWLIFSFYMFSFLTMPNNTTFPTLSHCTGCCCFILPCKKIATYYCSSLLPPRLNFYI